MHTFRISRPGHPQLLTACLLALLLAPIAAADGLSDVIAAAIERSLDQLSEDGDFTAARDRHVMLLDQVIAFGGERDKELFRDAAFTLRLVDQLASVSGADARLLLGKLRESPKFAMALAFAFKPELESADEVYSMASRLLDARDGRVETFATLAAAICVVHDKQLSVRVNENVGRSADPLAIFDYFVAAEPKLLYGIKSVPTELLVYVVDTTSSIDEMQWALNRYAGDRQVGARFFDIKYDYDHFRSGKPKKVTQAGWNLPNILRHGGVCADQAYFACAVGKAIGVPTTYTTGQSSDVAHAWVGFLQSDRGRAWWNFDTGRYEEYQGVRGVVIDPQIRRPIPDSYVSLLADFAQADPLDRYFVAAMTDAARRLAQVEAGGSDFTPAPPDDQTRRVRRRAIKNDQLAMIEAGLRACPGYAEAWFFVRQLAADGKLTLDDKKRWAEVLHRLCGTRYPDFYLAIAAPMIETIEDPKEQNKLWNAAFRAFSHRSDLAAAVRIAQARMWEAHGEQAKAGQCYEDVISRYANSGPFIINAVRGAEAILREQGQGRKVLALYEQTWAHIKRPQEMAGVFARQSNWFRVGTMYAERLEEAGLHEQASDVRSTLSGGR